MKRYLWPIGIAVAVVILWLAYTLSQLSAFHALQQLHVVTVNQFVREHPTSGWYQMNDGRLAYEMSKYGGRELSAEGATYHTYVPYADYKTKEWVALIVFIGQSESPEDLHPLAYTTKGPSQVQGLVYPYETIPESVLKEYEDDHSHIAPGMPVLVMGDAAVSPANKIIDTGVVGLIVIAASFAIAFFKTRPEPKPKYKDPYKYKPSWRK